MPADVILRFVKFTQRFMHQANDGFDANLHSVDISLALTRVEKFTSEQIAMIRVVAILFR